MQQAAQKVLWENRRLRELLVRNGITNEEIHRFIQDHERMIPQSELSNNVTEIEVKQDGNFKLDHTTATAPRKIMGEVESSKHPQATVDIGPELNDDGTAANIRRQPGQTPDDMFTVRRGVNKELEIDPTPGPLGAASITHMSGIYGSLNTETTPPITFMSLSPHLASSPPSLEAMNKSTLEMSCEAAASIVAGMRIHGDKHKVLQQLGCEQGNRCNVKNVDVLGMIQMN